MIMSVAVQYARLPGESFEDYKVRICENKNVYGLTFEQVAGLQEEKEELSERLESLYEKWEELA